MHTIYYIYLHSKLQTNVSYLLISIIILSNKIFYRYSLSLHKPRRYIKCIIITYTLKYIITFVLDLHFND